MHFGFDNSTQALISAFPRFIRLRDAPQFFGMDKNRFNAEVRPYLTEIRIGSQGRAFDRLEMEAAADEYKSRNGRPAATRRKLWDNTVDEDQDCNFVEAPGLSTKSSTEREFAKALEQATSKRPKQS
jgi:hypothetical protein